jgi:S1-C subfamily serine protease
MSIFFRKKDPSSPSRSILPGVIISVVFGFAAGAVGMLFVTGYYSAPQPLLLSAGFPVLREKVITPIAGLERVTTPVETAARSLALFYVAKDADGGLIAGRQIVLPSEAIGAGMVLTSDGWLVTHADILSGHGLKNINETDVFIGAKRYSVREAVRDPFTDVIFVKIDGSNLPVVAFGDGNTLAPGDSLFAFDTARGIRRLDVIGLDDRPLADVGGAVISSEKTQKFLRVSSADGILPGSMVIDRQGQVMGVYIGSGAVGSLVVPFNAFSAVIGGVLRDKSAHRPYLGVNFLDLSGIRSSGTAKGVLLTSSLDSRRPAVTRQSPAAKAGLRDGDIIVAVNGEDVTANNALAEILAEYGPESAITLTVERGAATLSLDVILGELPTP